MSRSIEQMQRQIELILNEIGADQTVFRTTLQCFLLNMARVRPELLPDLKTQVLWSIERTLPADDPAEQHGAERRKQLTLLRAEQLFQEIEVAIGQGETSAGGEAAH